MSEFTLYTELSVQKRMYIHLKNNTNIPFDSIKLCFTIPLAHIENLENAKVLTYFGSYVEFVPDEHCVFENNTWSFSFNTYREKHISDIPANPFVIYFSGTDEQIISVKQHPPVMKDYDDTDMHKNDKLVSSILMQKPSDDMVCIVPYPAFVEKKPATKEEEHLSCEKGLFLSSTHDTLESGIHSFTTLIKETSTAHFINTTKDTLLPTLSLEYKETPPSNIADFHNTKDTPWYSISIQAGGVVISSSNHIGIMYACISLQQLWVGNKGTLPFVDIEDTPRFEWRGFMLDTVRQFYSVEEIKRLIRVMAIHKLNIFHWHLTDDEAWRVELDSYPRLIDESSRRGYRMNIPPLFGSGAESYGGYYTKKNIADIVSYAKNYGVDIMPEFDVPSHCYALIRGLPELIEKDDKSSYASVQGYYPNTLNPALESTYEVLTHIFEEFTTLFPFHHFHFGGDERPQDTWKKSPSCNTLMKKNNFTHMYELQQYFMEKISKILHSHQKSCAAWEEAVAEGELDRDTIIFSWQGVEAGLRAAKKGYKVVMCPAQYYYLDMAQSEDPYDRGFSWAGYSHFYDTYNYEPIPKSLHENENIIGVQANLWSETLHNKGLLDYKLFPRLSALAETAWSKTEYKNFENFVHRVNTFHKTLLSPMGYHRRWHRHWHTNSAK